MGHSKARVVIIGALVTLFLNSMSVESVTAPLTSPWIGHAMFLAMVAIVRWDEAALRSV